MRVRPSQPEAVIRDPHTRRQLPAEGADVPDTSYWHRRLRSGDVVAADDEAVTPPELAPVAPLEHGEVQPLATREGNPRRRATDTEETP